MNKHVKRLFIFVLIISFLLAFSNSYTSLSIDNLAYVLAIGIDKSAQNKLQVSFQFSTTAPTSESGSTEKTTTVINTVSASSLSSAINLINGYMGKEVNMSHCKVIVFSEELAKEGISSEIYTLINDTQVRPSANIIISKCTAKYYIEETKAQLENLIAKYYEIFTNSSKYTGYMPNSTIGDFFNGLICKTCEPYAILGGLSNEQAPSDTSIDSQKDINQKSNQSTVIGDNGVENIGTAVFKGDKLVGELNAIETISFLSIQHKINRFLISISDPVHENSYIDIYLTPTNSPDIKIDTSNKSPYIKIKLKYSGAIYSMETDSNYTDSNILDEVSQSCNRYLEANFSNYLYKSSKEFHSDINGFGKYSLINFFTTEDFDNYNWLESYKDAFFDVEVDTTIKSSMLLTET